MKKIQQILSYYAIFDPAEEGGYNISFPDFPGCVTFGKTFEEARQMAKEVLELWLEEQTDKDLQIPRYSTRPIVDQVDVRVPAQAR
ncbi:MAG: type II toxin-antitoxin system HicB family antitoxin [bacterium]|nr:type II toxin-antitoxin system HicB family antitoxin [bacterium]